MKLNNVSFKGSMVVKGNQDDILELCSEIENKAHTQNPNFNYAGKAKPIITNFKFEMTPIEKDVVNKDLFVLMATNDDINKVGKVIKEAKSSGLFNFSGGFKAFYERNIDKYFANTPMLDADSALKAVGNNTLDFINLVIKK